MTQPIGYVFVEGGANHPLRGWKLPALVALAQLAPTVAAPAKGAPGRFDHAAVAVARRDMGGRRAVSHRHSDRRVIEGPVPELTRGIRPPTKDASAFLERAGVQKTRRDVLNLAQFFHQNGRCGIAVCAIAQLPVKVLPPTKDPPGLDQRTGMRASRADLDDRVAGRGQPLDSCGHIQISSGLILPCAGKRAAKNKR